MFKSDRYVTKGIITKIYPAMQLMLWHMIDEMEVTQKDYLQVFKLEIIVENGKRLQNIIHTQEQPEYKKSCVLNIKNPIKAKVFVIDDETHCTMLLADEYNLRFHKIFKYILSMYARHKPMLCRITVRIGTYRSIANITITMLTLQNQYICC